MKFYLLIIQPSKLNSLSQPIAIRFSTGQNSFLTPVRKETKVWKVNPPCREKLVEPKDEAATNSKVRSNTTQRKTCESTQDDISKGKDLRTQQDTPWQPYNITREELWSKKATSGRSVSQQEPRRSVSQQGKTRHSWVFFPAVPWLALSRSRYLQYLNSVIYLESLMYPILPPTHVSKYRMGRLPHPFVMFDCLDSRLVSSYPQNFPHVF